MDERTIPSLKKSTPFMQVLYLLERSPRSGNNIDIQEGSRVITISDTLANKLAKELRALLGDDNSQSD